MHTSILTDDKILSLSPADRWAWVALAAHTREHGTKGKLTISENNPFLAMVFGCPQNDVINTIKRLPNVLIEEGQKGNDKITLQYKNWKKYAEDNSLERVRKHRERKKCNVQEEKRGEEKRREENKTINTNSSFETFWKKYPNKKAKAYALKAWGKQVASDEIAFQTIKALERQIQERETLIRKKQWVPEWKHPATWINAQSWLDEPEGEDVVKEKSEEKCKKCGYGKNIHALRKLYIADGKPDSMLKRYNFLADGKCCDEFTIGETDEGQ